jgi:hypothetical protein
MLLLKVSFFDEAKAIGECSFLKNVSACQNKSE